MDHPTGQAVSPLEPINRDSRDKPENDPVDVATLEAGNARVPGEGWDPVSARSALSTRTALTPLIPTNVGILVRPCVLFRLAASSPHQQ